MRHDWRVSSGVFYTGAYPFRSMMVFRHSCSLEAIRFILHWSMRYDWVICSMWSQEHGLLIIVDIFLRWLDQDTDTYESILRSLVISGFALYWGIPLSLAVDLRDISSHWDMLFFFGEVRYSLHITTMALMSRCSFWSDDVWLVVLLSLMFDSEMLTLGHSPLIDDDFVRW